MSKIAKCPICQSTMTLYEEHMDGSDATACNKCSFTCAEKDLPRIAAAMNLAKATRTLEDAMEPLNSGKLKMGQALPAIRLAMEDQKACEQRVLEVFGK